MKRIIQYVLFLILLAVLVFLVQNKLGAFFCNQGNYYLQRQAYPEAISSYTNSIRINPGFWMAYFGLAEAYRENKDYQKAVREYKKVLSINPFYLRVYDALAEIYYQQGNLEEGLKVLLDGQKLNPADKKIKDSYKSFCFAYLADALSKSTELFISHKNKEAIFTLENALPRCSGSAFAYYTLGYYYYVSRNYESAEINLNKSIVLDPQFHYAYKLLSDIYFERKNIERAVFFAQQTMNLDSNDASSCHSLGLLLVHLERYEEAIFYLKKAVSLQPNNEDYVYSLGSVYRDNKMYRDAIAEYNKLSVLKNGYPNLHNDLADIYVLLGSSAQASAEYQKEKQNCQGELKNSPNDPILLNNYAHALNGSGQSEKALEVAKALVAAYPQYRQARLTMSWIYEKMNKYDLALESLQAAKQLSLGENFIEDNILRLKRSSFLKGKASGGSDRIYLKNGHNITGRIKKEYADKIVLEVGLGGSSGELIFYRNMIERIEK